MFYHDAKALEGIQMLTTKPTLLRIKCCLYSSYLGSIPQGCSFLKRRYPNVEGSGTI